MKSSRAFTLIEFLIVVAIIAILAAIAVPNFLEAQVRSVVSKTKSDMTVTAQAIEAYYSDHASYPLFIQQSSGKMGNRMDSLTHGTGLATSINSSSSSAELDTKRAPSFAISVSTESEPPAFGHITSPVAYMRQYPTDPFDPQSAGTFTYAADGSAFILASRGPVHNPAFRKQSYAKPGQTGITVSGALASQIEEGLNEPLNGEKLRRTRNIIEFWEYDPTNGTVSQGEITYISE